MAKSPAPQAKSGASQIDFSSYTLEELARIKRDLEGEIESRKSKEIEELRAKARESALALGISIEELLGVSIKRHTKHARGKQPAKYRGPDGEEWSGRGPAPRWMKPYLAKGKTKEDFLIKQAA